MRRLREYPALAQIESGQWICRTCLRAMRDGAETVDVERGETQGRGVWHFFSKVVGVTYQNPDGSDRQTIIAECEPLERLELVNEGDNPVDANAIAVRRSSGGQLGYMSAALAAEVVARHRKGYRHCAYVTAVTGGEPGRPIVGANILVIVAEPGVNDRSVMEYIDEVIATDERLLAELGVDSLTACATPSRRVTHAPGGRFRKNRREP